MVKKIRQHVHQWVHRWDGDTRKVWFFICKVEGCTEVGYMEKPEAS